MPSGGPIRRRCNSSIGDPATRSFLVNTLVTGDRQILWTSLSGLRSLVLVSLAATHCHCGLTSRRPPRRCSPTPSSAPIRARGVEPRTSRWIRRYHGGVQRQLANARFHRLRRVQAVLAKAGDRRQLPRALVIVAGERLSTTRHIFRAAGKAGSREVLAPEARRFASPPT